MSSHRVENRRYSSRKPIKIGVYRRLTAGQQLKETRTRIKRTHILPTTGGGGEADNVIRRDTQWSDRWDDVIASLGRWPGSIAARGIISVLRVRLLARRPTCGIAQE